MQRLGIGSEDKGKEREGHLGFRVVSLSLTCLQMLHGIAMSKDKESNWTQ